MPNARRSATWVLAVAAVVVPIVVLGTRATGAPPPASSSGRMNTYAEILALIEERYVPQADTKKVIYSSINGMLDTLDPHTNFLDDENYREMREEQRGVFFGLGIVISKRGRYQPLRVIAPIADTPADRLGIRGGDVITHIRDERAGVDIDTIDLTIQEAVKYLRGPRGSEVEVRIDRPGLPAPISFKIVRDAVRTPAVNQVAMVRPGIGYIHVANFTETTTNELDAALDRLKGEGARRLVLDLTGNPGGLLDQAISVTSRFLDSGELVVYTEGRNAGSRQDYVSQRDVPRIDWPLVVLVDRESASASEIVSGALQDHDRAIVVGETTFGKGLVQSVYPLSEGTALALTTQKYYTPVGRSIQRPYQSQDEYFLENRDRAAVPQPKTDSPVYHTDTGRVVYGGGGITPDIEETYPDPPAVLGQLASQSAFSRFVTPLADAERALYAKESEPLWTAFVAFVGKELEGIETAQLVGAKEECVLQLRGELALAAGGMAARDRVLLERNPLLLKALESFDQADALFTKKREVAATAAPDKRR